MAGSIALGTVLSMLDSSFGDSEDAPQPPVEFSNSEQNRGADGNAHTVSELATSIDGDASGGVLGSGDDTSYEE